MQPGSSMMSDTPVMNTVSAVEQIIARTNGDIRLGLPLGLGKPNHLVNALYRHVRDNPDTHLQIYTALTLGRPRAGSDLEKRFLAPFVERVFGDYEELDYLGDLKRNRLPANVEVFEFFFQPGAMLNVPRAQQNYISSNYTHVARDIDGLGLNVMAQMVAPHPDGEPRVSLSCNPEVSLDVIPLMQARRERGEAVLLIGQLHPDLPYMLNDAEVGVDAFDLLVSDDDANSHLFVTPNMPVTLQDHFIGLHASSLLRDDGLVQIGIGALGDALVHHALARQHENAAYQALLRTADASTRFQSDIDAIGGQGRFDKGLYGCSEMVTAGLLGLLDGGVIRRPVLDDVTLMRLFEQGRIGETPTLQTLEELLEEGVLSTQLSDSQLDWLVRQGILAERPSLVAQELVFADGESLVNDLGSRHTLERLQKRLGSHLRAILLHGGFFLGPGAFYARLREMSEQERLRINMTHISYVNNLYGQETLKRYQRRNARFMNTVFTATLMGAAVSDQLEDGRTLSGVGGQYNFVVQGHELEGARSVLMLRAWRERGGDATSNLVWNYGHTTIPRHLRDVYVTEYGIADVRGKPDNEVIARMLAIADSRFQQSLLEQARKAGKIAADYVIPEQHRYNTPERLQAAKQQAGGEAFPMFPLGCDFDAVEQRLLPALSWLKEKMSQRDYLALGRGALGDHEESAEAHAPMLQRMGLDAPDGLRERLFRRLLLAALDATDAG